MILHSLIRRHEQSGGLFWDEETVAYVDMVTPDKLWAVPGGWLFITGQCYLWAPASDRLWTVRFINRYGNVATISREGGLTTKQGAYSRARELQKAFEANPTNLKDRLHADQ